MSSIIKSSYIKQGSIINLQERMQSTYINNEENAQDEIKTPIETIVSEPEISYNALYEQAIEEKELILFEARQEAEQVIARACEKIEVYEKKEIQRIEEKLQKADEQATYIIEEARQEAQKIRDNANKQKEDVLRQAEPEIVEIIKMLVSHILYEEVAKSNKWISYVVKKMIAKEKLLGDLIIHVSPNTLTHLGDEDYKEFETIKHQIILESDESLSDTTCMVETTEGSILYDLSEGLDKMIKDLTALGQLKVEAIYD